MATGRGLTELIMSECGSAIPARRRPSASTVALRIVLGSLLVTLAVGLVLAALLRVWGGASWLVQWELAMGAAAAITGASILLGSVRGRRTGASIEESTDSGQGRPSD